jgi:hypothetical protein
MHVSIRKISRTWPSGVRVREDFCVIRIAERRRHGG